MVLWQFHIYGIFTFGSVTNTDKIMTWLFKIIPWLENKQKSPTKSRDMFFFFKNFELNLRGLRAWFRQHIFWFVTIQPCLFFFFFFSNSMSCNLDFWTAPLIQTTEAAAVLRVIVTKNNPPTRTKQKWWMVMHMKKKKWQPFQFYGFFDVWV